MNDASAAQPASGAEPQMLQHSRVRLALHTLRPAAERSEPTRPLLLLHGLGERSPASLPPEYAPWPGSVLALDFTGHGASSVPQGGGYTCELLMADVDVAIAHVGVVTLVGRGLGAYVALLIAGARPDLVRGALLRDGPGLAGGGSGSTSPFVPFVDREQVAPPDPYAIVELATDIRPPDYAAFYVREAVQRSGLDRPISVCTRERPGWLAGLMTELGVEETTVAEALEYHARASD